MVSPSAPRIVAVGATLAVGLAMVVTGPVTGDQSPIDLAIAGATRMDGAAAQDLSAGAVSSAGDVNGDGFDDVVIGAPRTDNHSRADSGSAYVVFGSAGPASVDLAGLGNRGFRIDGAGAGDEAGWSVAGVGDVNGDGFDDVVVGAIAVDVPGRTNAGAAYVVFGSAGPSDVDLLSLGTRGFRIVGATAGDSAGYAVAPAGDVNRDGRPDVLIGAPGADFGDDSAGASYVIYGGASTANVDLAGPGGRGFRIDGAAASDQSGTAVAGVGDVNGDGYDDVAVAAPEAGNHGSLSGSTWVVFGSAAPVTVDLAGLGSHGFRIDGAAADVLSGSAVAGPGDVNADGRDDVLIGAPYTDNGTRISSGSSFVVFGSASATTVNLGALGTRGLRIDGAATGDYSGWSVAGAGDVNADGHPDLVIGAPMARANDRTLCGSGFVVYGGALPAAIDLASLASYGFRIDGATTGDFTAEAVAAAGDINADGGGDILLGAVHAAYNSRTDSGSTYLVLGTPPPQVTPTPSTTPAATLTVKSRAAKKAVPKTGKATLVKKVTVGPGQKATITVKVKPKRTKKKVKVAKTATKVKVRTRKAPKGKVTVKITSSGAGFTPVTWTRTWKVR